MQMENPKFKVGDRVRFLNSILYIVSRQIREEKYYYGLAESPTGEAFLTGISEEQLEKA